MIKKIVSFILIATVINLFLFSVIPLMYMSAVPFIVAPVFIIRTLGKARKQGDKSAQKIVSLFGLTGLIVAFAFSVFLFANLKGLPELQAICQKPDARLFLAFAESAFFPSSVFYTSQTIAADRLATAAAPVFFAAIAVNTLLYMAYGCAFYYYRGIFAKNEAPA